jgi:hypothetical protein
MRSLIYSFALAISLTLAWFIQIVGALTYSQLEITVPPSPYGPPQIYIRSGADVSLIKPFSETYLSDPSPHFIDDYRIPNSSTDEVRVLSESPPERLDRISARLIDSDRALLAQWGSTSFQSTPLVEAKNAQQLDTLAEESFAYATRLDAPVWHSFGAHQVPWLTLLFFQIGFSTFFYALFRFLPLFRKPVNRVFRTLACRPSVTKSMRPLILSLACLSGVILFSIGTWLIFGTYYGTVDDPYMTLVAKGYLMKTPEWHLFFTHPVIGFILVHLYETMPNVPWYVLFMVSLNILSFSAITYAIVRRSRTWMGLILWIIVILVAGLYLIASVQFTMVSTMACSAAVVLIFGVADQAAITRARLAAAVAFFLLGAAVRIHPALLVIIMVGPCAGYLWLRGSLPGTKRFALAVFVGLALLALTDAAAYRLSPVWREAKSYDTARGILNGTEIMKKYDDNADVFKAVGWSKNDLKMFNEGLYEDATVYSKDKLNYLVTHLHLPPVGLKNGFWAVVRDLSGDYAAVVLYLTCLIFVLAWRLMPRTQVLMLALPCMVVFSYLAIVVRLPQRVLCPTIFMEMALLLLLASLEGRSIKLRTVLFGAIVMTLLCGLLLVGSISGLYRYSQYSDQRQRATVEALTALSKGDSPIIVNTVCGTSADQTYLWQDFPELRNITIMQLAWFGSPIYDQRMERLGLDDVFSDLAHRPDIVLAITRWDLPQITAIETFFREHRGMRVQFELAKIPGTDKDAVFPFFSLFKATIVSGNPPP